MIKQIISAAVVAAVACTALGCQKNTIPPASAETPKELTYWTDLNGDISLFTDNQGNTEFSKELQRRTGVKLKFIHPPRSSFNLLVASKELPDIMAYPWYEFPGGAQKAIDDNIILQLNNVMEQYAPNLTAYLKENPEVDKMVKTDKGSYYVFPFIRGDERLTVSLGPVVRRDWLDQLGMKIPETMDDWYQMLNKFKQMGVASPLTLTPSDFGCDLFVGAYGVIMDSYIEDGTVKYGPIQPQYKEFLTTMKKWYDEGLIDPYFSSNYFQKVEYNILNDKSGATMAYLGSGMGKWLKIMEEQGAGKSLAATSYPVLKRGEKQKFTSQNQLYTFNNCVAITTSCKEVEAAAKFLDYGYGEEGHMLYNFGIEGVSYRMENGYPRYTDKVIQETGMTRGLANYTQFFSGPFVQDVRYIEQYYTYPQQMEAVNTWLDNENEKYRLPLIYISDDRQDRLSQISKEVKDYVKDMLIKFIMGIEPIEKYDDYVAYIKNLGIDEMLSYQQEALASYRNR